MKLSQFVKSAPKIISVVLFLFSFGLMIHQEPLRHTIDFDITTNAQDATPSASPTASASASPSPSPTASSSASPSPTATASATPSPTPTPTACPNDSDLNADSSIDIFDYTILAANYNSASPDEADINCDGNVDIFDYTILASNYGT